MSEFNLAEDVRLDRLVTLEFLSLSIWDTREGTEFIRRIRLPMAIAELESAGRFANPTDRGKIKDPALSEFSQTFLRKY